MLTVAFNLDGPDQTFVVSEYKISPQVLTLPLVMIVIPEPDLIDSFGPLRIVLKEPLAEDFELLASTLFTELGSYGCYKLIECCQRIALIELPSDDETKPPEQQV